jgi:hypothetical protein
MATRRGFIGAAVAVCSSGAMGGGGQAAGEEVDLLDYGRSFVCNTAKFNAVRMWIESRTIVFDDQARTRSEYYQCGSCKSENTFHERGLFQKVNYDFLPIFGAGNALVFRRYAEVNARYRQIRPYAGFWGEPNFRLKRPVAARPLVTWEEIRDATAEGTPLVARTEIADPKSGLRAILEYPVKTMNVDLNHRKYQVDTGPVALPDLAKRYQPQIESLSLAYVAFNVPGFADFVIEQPMRVPAGREAAEVYHYSGLRSVAAKNRVWAIG